MTISNNLNAMNQSMNALNDSMTKISRATEMGQISEDTDLNSEVSDSLINEITNQIPQQIGYEMNAQVISTKDEIMESLINIKA